MGAKPTPNDTTSTVQAALERLKQHGNRLHAVAEMLNATALAEARRCDDLAAAKSSAGPLHGLPIVVKDIIDVVGVPTRSGSLTRSANPPAAKDAPVVAALRGAGAIPIAKSNTVEFAIGGWGINRTVGTPWNPWDLKTHRVPGGSSSGTGALVGAGVVTAGLGTDTGGSVRLPAAWSGCVGLKTSIGLVSRTGVTPLSETLDTIGPMTETVEIAARMLTAMQGPDATDPTTMHAHARDPLAGLHRGAQGLRLARINREHMPHLSAEMAEAFDRAVDQLRDAGATIVECTLPMALDEYQRIGSLLSASEAYASYGDLADDPTSPLGPGNRARILRGKGVTASDYVRLRRLRDRSIADFEAVIDTADAIILPTTPYTAPPVADVDEADLSYGTHVRFVNYLELAGLAVPIALSPHGLPTSLQIVVRRYDDPLALRIGAAYEKVRGPFPKPSLA
ncbi:MAG: amidase [Hyphomicrobiaceae bacterium]